MKAIVLYDFLLEFGGAESVTIALSNILDGAEICTDFVQISDHRNVYENCHIKVLGNPVDPRFLRYMLGIRHFTQKTLFLKEFDLVIYSGTTAPCAVHNHPTGRNIHYCHTIPRFVYDLREFTLANLPVWQRPLAVKMIDNIKRHYESAARSMDLTICNSKNVQKRLRKHLNLDSIVIYPPCDTSSFLWREPGNYFLSTARLEPFKRVDRIVKAFIVMPEQRLIVASGGSQLRELKKLANGHDNIEFTGWIDRARLIQLMGGCRATIYIPIDEDFGISPVESMSAGKPVIGVSEGGMLETVISGETGVLLRPDPSIEEIQEAVRAMTGNQTEDMRESCEKRAELFSQGVFADRISEVLNH